MVFAISLKITVFISIGSVGSVINSHLVSFIASGLIVAVLFCAFICKGWKVINPLLNMVIRNTVEIISEFFKRSYSFG